MDAKMIDSSDHQDGIVGLIVKGGLSLRNHVADERIRCIHPGGTSKWA